MDTSSYINPGTIKSQCESAINILQKNNQDLQVAVAGIANFTGDASIQSTAFQAMKQQLADYTMIVRALEAANLWDISDFQTLSGAVGGEILDGSIIIRKKTAAQRDKQNHQNSATNYRLAARTLSLVSPVSTVISYYYKMAEYYDQLAENDQKIIKDCEEKEQKYDQIEARTSGLFSCSQQMRIAASSGIGAVSCSFRNGAYHPDMKAAWRDDIRTAYQNKMLYDMTGGLSGAKGQNIGSICSKDPVDLSTGNFIYNRTDLKIGGNREFSFRRFYNALNSFQGALGSDWNHNYELSIKFDWDSNSTGLKATVMLEDGKEEIFCHQKDGVFGPVTASQGFLSKTEEGYVYQTLSGERKIFDTKGMYQRMEDANGNGESLIYEENPAGKKVLAKVQKDTGEFFAFTYREDGTLEAVTDSTGRKVIYEVKESLLTTVTLPEKSCFQYSYDITGKLDSVVGPSGITSVKSIYDGKQRVTHQEFPDGGVMSFDYHDETHEITMTERNGSKSIHVHDEKWRNVRNIYPDGEESFVYNDRNQKTKMIDKLGNETRLSYDNHGNMTGIINALGVKTAITYGAQNQPVSISIDGKRKQTNRFDVKGNLLETVDALDRETHFSYNEKGLPESIVQADGSTINLTYDEKGNITEVIDVFGGKTVYSYDHRNQVVEVVDPKGNHTGFTYDIAGNILSVTNASRNTRTYEYNKSNKVTKITDFDGSVIQRVYNVLNRPEKLIDQLGRETKLSYDSMWNISGILEPNGAKTVYRYNENNRLKEIEDAIGNKKQFTYDGNGNRLSETDELGVTTKFSYDPLGQLIHVKAPEGMEYSYIYDNEGNVTEVTDALGGKVTMEYDAAGQLIKEINQLGDSRSYTYTALGNVDTITDEAGRITRHTYYLGGQLESVLHSDGTKECYTYENNGNVSTYTNASGFVLTYHYDELGQIMRIAGSEGEKKEYTYDAVGNVTSMVDGLGNMTRYEYTLTGQLSKVMDALGNETEYTYDVCDRLIEIRQFGEDGSLKEGADTSGMDEQLLQAEKQNQRNRICHVTKYQRNQLGQIDTITDALGLEEHYQYDSKGQLLEKLDKEGYLTSYGYTAQGDISRIQYADGREVKLSYNPLRHLQEMEDWIGVTKIQNDVLGRAEKVTYPDGKQAAYTYGKAGERTSLTYPDGRTVHYGFDEHLRLSELKDGDRVITYGYDQAGMLAEKHFPNGMFTQYSYDKKGQIRSLIHHDTQGMLDQYRYDYDRNGNKTIIEKQRKGLEQESGLYHYGYDALGRLHDVKKDGKPLRTYDYDAFGNRVHMEDGGRAISYNYNNVNQLLSKVDSLSEEQYRYDKRGNLSQIVANGQVKNQYVYGALNRLEQAVNNNGEAAKYQYNGLGHRVAKSIGHAGFQEMTENLNPMRQLQSQTILPENQIQYTIDLTKEYHNLLQKEESLGKQTYLWDGNVAGMSEDGDNKNSYYFQDELGSPIRLADEEGSLTVSYGYDEFGRNLYQNQGGTQPFGYTGYQPDRIAGTAYAQAREYQAGVGRFSGQDLINGFIELPFTTNRYNYCFANPMVLVDLNGAWPKWIETAAKVVTVGVAVVAVGAVVIGTGGLAATVVAGMAVGGVVGGMTNERAGGSYLNGYAGGALSGGIQALTGKIPKVGPLGTIIGGAANGLGSWVTDNLDNIDPYNNKYKTPEQINDNALKTAGRGVICSIPGGSMQWMTDFADVGGSVARELMGYTSGFGRGLGQFYGILDNLLLVGWSDEECLE
ncbi:MAG: DUF6531 domain-containing protein [Hespellia sp.]|nr:DUF6531 domain-containing protein [Hespellia sp.]